MEFTPPPPPPPPRQQPLMLKMKGNKGNLNIFSSLSSDQKRAGMREVFFYRKKMCVSVSINKLRYFFFGERRKRGERSSSTLRTC